MDGERELNGVSAGMGERATGTGKAVGNFRILQDQSGLEKEQDLRKIQKKIENLSSLDPQWNLRG